jgi:hypothetical protein
LFAPSSPAAEILPAQEFALHPAALRALYVPASACFLALQYIFGRGKD